MGAEPEFVIHPECLKWPPSVWRHLFLQIEEDIHWMRPGQLAELVLAVRTAESDAHWPDYPAPAGWWPEHPATEVGKWAVLELHLREFPSSQIDDIFGFPEGTADDVIASGKLHPKAHEIVASHFLGRSPSRIARDVGVGIPTICELLRKIGEEPHLMRDLARTGDQNRAIVKLYDDMVKRGVRNIYREIGRQVGLEEKVVKQRIQYQRRKGRIQEPPPGGGRRRGPAA